MVLKDCTWPNFCHEISCRTECKWAFSVTRVGNQPWLCICFSLGGQHERMFIRQSCRPRPPAGGPSTILGAGRGRGNCHLHQRTQQDWHGALHRARALRPGQLGWCGAGPAWGWVVGWGSSGTPWPLAFRWAGGMTNLMKPSATSAMMQPSCLQRSQATSKVSSWFAAFIDWFGGLIHYWWLKCYLRITMSSVAFTFLHARWEVWAFRFLLCP